MDVDAIIELAVQCPECGQWQGRVTSIRTITTARVRCKVCGASRKLRGKFGKNIGANNLRVNETLSECVMRLNKENVSGNEKQGYSSASRKRGL